MLPGDPNAITDEKLREVRDLGFSGFGVSFRVGLDALTDEVCSALRGRFADSGLDPVEMGMYSSNLVHPDASVRAENVRGLQRAIGISAKIGRPCVNSGSGSLNPKGAWLPHPENAGDAAHDRMVSALREVVKAAEGEGVVVGLECHAFTALYSPEVARRTLDEVGSKSLKVHLDGVNWITWQTIYRTGEAIRHMFEVLPPEYIGGAHSKGIEIEDRLAIHMNETPAGAATDLFDHVAYLREIARLPANTYLVIEHTPVDLIPRTRDFVLARAREAGAVIG
jgi:sugar phosphate isomerase/epimerase